MQKTMTRKERGMRNRTKKPHKRQVSFRLSSFCLACVQVERWRGKHKSLTSALEALIVQGHFAREAIARQQKG